MTIASLLEEGGAKLATKRQAEAAAKQAEEDGKMGVRLSAWMNLIDAAAKEAPEIANFLITEMPENWGKSGHYIEIPHRGEATFAVPGCYPFVLGFDCFEVEIDLPHRACQSKYEWKVSTSHHDKGYGQYRGKFLVRFPGIEYGRYDNEPWIGNYGKREATDDIGVALALALEAEVEHLKLQKEIADKQQQRAEGEAKRKATPTPTLEERLVAVLREFIQDQIPEPVE